MRRIESCLTPFVPAEVGNPVFGRVLGPWIPAFAGMNGDRFNGGASLNSSPLDSRTWVGLRGQVWRGHRRHCLLARSDPAHQQIEHRREQQTEHGDAEHSEE